jgi:methylase of polypeptide subunit release factors
MPMEDFLTLGRALTASGYRFITPTSATIDRVNERHAGELALDPVAMFGWGRTFGHTPDSAPVTGVWFAALQALGLVTPCPGGGWRTPLRAATLGCDLLFHTSGPGAAEDAVFFGPDSYRFVRALQTELAVHPQHCRRVLDLGCGAGAGALTLARAFPGAEVLATDVNPQALAFCAVNARLAGRPNVLVRDSNLFAAVGGAFDLIVSNPPFIADSQERTYRHGGGALGLQLSLDIVQGALPHLAPGGALMIYTGVAIVRGADPYIAAVQPLLEQAGLTVSYAELDPDIFGGMLDTRAYREADRIAAVWLVARRAAEARPV